MTSPHEGSMFDAELKACLLPCPNVSQDVDNSLPKLVIFWRLLCRNSPYSCAPASSNRTSCRRSGLRVTIPVPRGRKSLPTTASSTELLPELCIQHHLLCDVACCRMATPMTAACSCCTAEVKKGSMPEETPVAGRMSLHSKEGFLTAR